MYIVIQLCILVGTTERIANNGTMFLGDADWLGPVNAIAQANNLIPLTWNQTLVDTLTKVRDCQHCHHHHQHHHNPRPQAARNATSSGAPCGFVNRALLPTISFNRVTPSWQTSGTSFLLFLQFVGMYTNATLQPTDDIYGFSAAEIERLGYVFAGPSAVSMGCIVQSCNTTYTSTYCLTNLTIGGPADNFNLTNRASFITTGMFFLAIDRTACNTHPFSKQAGASRTRTSTPTTRLSNRFKPTAAVL